MTWCSITKATSGTRISARCSSARWTRRPASGHAISDPGDQAGLLARHAQSRNRQGRQSLGRPDVSERDRQVRSQDAKIRGMVDAQGMGHRRRPARASRGRRHAGRRQGVDQEFRRRPHLSAGPRVEQVRGPRRAEGSAHRQAHRHLRHPRRCREQSLSARFLRRQHRAARCQDQGADGLSDADAELASAARPRRRPGPAVVRRIFRQRHRHARSGDRQDPGMESADAVVVAL